jgi:hypothetical protein
MPIRPERRSRYPKDWKQISLRIRERSGGRCECEGECGLHHGRRCCELNGQPATFARGNIILTVAHLNHDEADCRDENLKAMCQRCHLRYDAPRKAREAKERRRAARNTIELKLIERNYND